MAFSWATHCLKPVGADAKASKDYRRLECFHGAERLIYKYQNRFRKIEQNIGTTRWHAVETNFVQNWRRGEKDRNSRRTAGVLAYKPTCHEGFSAFES
jgi:hypothetical protein